MSHATLTYSSSIKVSLVITGHQLGSRRARLGGVVSTRTLNGLLLGGSSGLGTNQAKSVRRGGSRAGTITAA